MRRIVLSVAVVGFLAGSAVLAPVPAHAGPPTLTAAPSSTTVAVNDAEELHVEYDSDGSGPAFPSFQMARANWTSSNPAVASVANSGSSKGTVTGRAPGTATVTATYSGLSTQITVNVRGVSGQLSFTTPDGRTRSYVLYVPDTYNPATPTPLVIMFHGGGTNARMGRELSQWNSVARANGFIVAYPNGTGFFTDLYTFNAGGCCAYAMDNDVDDITFTSMLIDHVDAAQGYNVDLSRVYAVGMSNGGMMSHRLACRLSGRIAAIGAVAGGLNFGGSFTSCNPSRHVPVIMFHGTTDTTVPYHGDAEFRSIPQTRDDWLAVNGLAAVSPSTSYANGISTCRTWASGADEVTLCTQSPTTPASDVGGVVYDGGGHAWPGGIRPGANYDFPTADVGATSRIWAFFAAHPKP